LKKQKLLFLNASSETSHFLPAAGLPRHEHINQGAAPLAIRILLWGEIAATSFYAW